LAYYGWRVGSLLHRKLIQIPFQSKPSLIIGVTVILFLLFMSRAIYELLAALPLGIAIVLTSKVSWKELGMFVCFIVWEIIPTILVIFLFWRIPRSPKNIVLPRRVSVNTTPTDIGRHQGVVSSIGTASLFENPKRYDSDDDQPFSPSPYCTTPTTPSNFLNSHNFPHYT